MDFSCREDHRLLFGGLGRLGLDCSTQRSVWEGRYGAPVMSTWLWKPWENDGLMMFNGILWDLTWFNHHVKASRYPEWYPVSVPFFVTVFYAAVKHIGGYQGLARWFNHGNMGKSPSKVKVFSEKINNMVDFLARCGLNVRNVPWYTHGECDLFWKKGRLKWSEAYPMVI